MPAITFYKHEPIPMEMHKVKIVQQLHLLPTAQRLEKMQRAGFNTFQLHNGDIFLDMLTDSGVNAMSDLQQSAMLRADDAYAGSETFFRMRDKLEELFGMPFCLPAHQGRACENILATRFVKPDSCVIMNYHFTTAKAHITRLGGRVEELVRAEGLVSKSDLPFKGNIDLHSPGDSGQCTLCAPGGWHQPHRRPAHFLCQYAGRHGHLPPPRRADGAGCVPAAG